MYEPRRDSRFEYVWEAMAHVEERQCTSCALQNNRDDEYFMCGEIEYKLMECEPVEEFSDLGELGLHCNKYRDEDLEQEGHPDQGRLI